MDSILINQRELPFELRRHRRAKNMILKIDPHAGKVILTVPWFTLKFQIRQFLVEKATWIERQWTDFEHQQARQPRLEHSLSYYKNQAKVRIRERLAHFKSLYGFEFNRVFFKDQKTRWGSCSSEKNLNFNWRLILSPPEVLDYVVVHELCHLREMNHSKKFWALVAREIPDYKRHQHWLKENHHLLMANV